MEQSFRDLVRDLEKQKEEVRAGLEQREQDAVGQVKVIVDALEQRAKVLHEDKQTREQLHSISDSVLFLQVAALSRSSVLLPLSQPLTLHPSSHASVVHPSTPHSLSPCNVSIQAIPAQCRDGTQMSPGTNSKRGTEVLQAQQEGLCG